MSMTISHPPDAATLAADAAFTGVYVAKTWHVVKVKTADETVNNSSTLQNDDHLSFSIGANEVWVATFHLFMSAVSATPDIKVALAVPASTTSAMGLAASATAVAGGAESDVRMQSFTAATTALTAGVPATADANSHAIYSAYVATAGTSGTVQFQWAQAVANASDSKIRLGSYMVADRIS